MAHKFAPCIYRIVNTVNGKVYVGSALRPKKRERDHFGLLAEGKHHSRHLQAAWDKYGPEVFRFEVMEYVPESDLIVTEQKYFDEIRPYKQENGYNMSPTAGSTFGIPCSPEKAEKIGAANRGKKRSEKHKAILRMYGGTKHYTEETYKKLSEASKRHKSYLIWIEAGCAARRGKPLSEAGREKISLALKSNKKQITHCQDLARSQRKFTDDQIAEMRKLRALNKTYAEIAALFKTSSVTARKWCLAADPELSQSPVSKIELPS